MKFESAQNIIRKKSAEVSPNAAIERVDQELLANGVLVERKLTDLDGEREIMGMFNRFKFSPPVSEHDIVFFSGFTNRVQNFESILPQIALDTDSSVHGLNELPGVRTGDALYDHERQFSPYKEQMSKAITVAEFAAYDGISDMDVIAHSQGAIESLIMAVTNPGLVKNMVLVNPAGIIPMTEKELTMQGLKEFVTGVGKGGEGATFDQKIADVIENFGVLKDSRATIADFSQNENMVDLIQSIREHGTKVGIIMTDQDKLFEITKMYDQLTDDKSVPLYDRLDGHKILAGNHGSILSQDNLHEITDLMTELRDREPQAPKSTFG